MKKRRNVLIAIDSFKGSITSSDAASAIERGLRAIDKNIRAEKVPLADGGEGTVKSIVEYAGGSYVNVEVKDPLMRNVEAVYGLIKGGQTAVIEMSAASGIGLLSREEYNPLVAISYGTGQLIKDALDKGCKDIIIGIGGSVTNDAGIGMAIALGAKFINENGIETSHEPKNFHKIHSIDFSDLDSRVKETEITVLCDVNNPLLGKNGASYVYGPQKGASPETVKLLDEQLAHIADVVELNSGNSLRDIPGAGAAGGLGFGLIAFLNAQLLSGINFLCDFLNLEEKIKDADLVITGEGKVDFQTKFNKLPLGIAELAHKHSKKIICIAGVFDESAYEMKGKQFDDMFSIMEEGVTSEEAIQNAAFHLENITARELKKYLGD
jgi:glycerate 2-kinase